MSVTDVTSAVQPYQQISANYPSYLQKDLQNLGNALQGGDTATAQQGFAQLLQDLQNPAQGVTVAQAGTQGAATGMHHHHHHHHHKTAGAGQDNGTQSAQGTTSASNSAQLAQNLLSQPVSGILPASAGSATGSLS